jgi:ABC-type polysaccharide/polyol phosphate transport system ATPase subunit
MSLPAIEVSGLSKRYVIEHESRHGTLRDTLHHAARKLWRRARWGTGFQTEEFWALRDVSFSVQPGEVVGIVGRNGAGKSTLLKVISRITEPTAGRVTLRGRVASLLEVGTGFHPDLTGRENIYLNGAILGMNKQEIRGKFDEIVAFAAVEQFLDTPVKRYSSGMYVRLAFAVAAHLEPEILILDEVLAVGDAEFQRKCLGKMNDVAHRGGRTVLFVSHNLASVQQLCDRAIVLQHGRVIHDTDAASGVAAYLALGNQTKTAVADRLIGHGLEIDTLSIRPGAITVFEEVQAHLVLRARVACTIHELCLLFMNGVGQRAALADLRTEKGTYILAAGQTLDLRVKLPRTTFVPGSYSVDFFIRTGDHMQNYAGLQSLDVLPRATTNNWAGYGSEYLGSVAVDPQITVKIAP